LTNLKCSLYKVAKNLQKELIKTKHENLSITHVSKNDLNIFYFSTGIIKDTKLHKHSTKKVKKLFKNLKIISFFNKEVYFFTLTTDCFFVVLTYS
jgi:hypothetical protein